MSGQSDGGDARIHYYLDSGRDDRGAPIIFVPGMTDIADDHNDVLALFRRRTVVVELRGRTAAATPRPTDTTSGHSAATSARS